MSKRLRASTVLKALKRVSQIPGPLTHFVSKKILGTLHPDMPRRAIPEGDETASAAALEPGNPGKFVERIYKSALGSRNYKVYIPKGYKSSPLPVVVMLHGCTQTPDDFAAGTGMNDLADRDGFLVIYPAQSAAANVLRCWNWFNPKDQDRARGEPSLIAGITLEISAEFAVDKQRIFVAGLSAGAAMAVILGATYPDLFSAVGAHSGLPYRAARGVTSRGSPRPGMPTAMHDPMLEHGSRLRIKIGSRRRLPPVFETSNMDFQQRTGALCGSPERLLYDR